ncbi:uncharacterized protein PFL1_03838 [Pseudozyma flocculosa PF-1]|uniref:UBX domain-containing protein n=2 Tax=Pseudozyma flocculosa TaxID=84751 RepID=A0A5C3EXU8_9BASI|nr:uncharacterized protein PFL1_03838 [Pseudozyma flocculosa PF-1]EPQ28534.1 hypothetical protein PFL1_03838 [Pseudozyma flocculosa PF-1]SPO36456.1 uncharacterized protein PSFLO_01927 [Pseudozyma flocculosa]
MDEVSRQAAAADLRNVLRASGTALPDEAMLTTLLEIEGWDVQRAARAIQDDSAAERRRSGADDEEIARSFAARPPVSAFEVDDGLAARRATRPYPGGVGLSSGRGPLGDRPGGMSISSIVWSAITFPLSLAQSILLLIARIFRLRSLFPGLFGGAPGSDGWSRMPKVDPRICAERFVRELEEETGATSGPRSALPAAASEASSTSRSRDGTGPPPAPRIPPFHIGGYSDALKLAKEQIKILMVVLTSREHGDAEHFRRKVLVDEELVELVSRPDFVVWGGDVREREAYQVATQLEATTYPFVAFIALQPARAARRAASSQSGASSSSPRPAVLSRLEGSPMTATSAQSISSHIADVLLPRTRTYLDRLRSEKRRREIERELKAEQDRAYEEASRRDAERVARKREEERQRALEAERQRRAQAELEAQQQKRRAWLGWAKRHLVPEEPSAGQPAIRLAFRLPDGKNLSRSFQPSDRLESVFAYVETHAAGVDEQDSAALSVPPSEYEHRYDFTLVLGYPRKQIGPELLAVGADGSGKTLGDIDGLAPSANLIVEGKVGRASLSAQDDDDDDSSDSDNDD